MPSTKLAIMQPYIFPYLGYFQLVNAVDTFVFYDDVHFIKRGWINRNKILVNGTEKLISFPCIKASQNKLINEVEIDLQQKEYKKLLQSISMAYKKAPYFEEVFPVIEKVFLSEATNIASLAIDSIKEVMNYLGITKQFKISSEAFATSKGLEKQERLIQITLTEKVSTYINALGGQELYSKDDFKKEEIDLFFLKASLPEYPQFSDAFVPGLSIIDVLMMNSKAEVKAMLNQYELI
ncbi:MAG: WbqC family protein [Flavobacteriaceae bacterium]|nr:WbqC family protein [Flavobacteriaceae bacterium]